MIAVKKKKNIFLEDNTVDVSPRILRKRKVTRFVTPRGEEVKINMLKVELKCHIDQRALLENKVEEIKVFLSRDNTQALKKRRDLFREASTPPKATQNTEQPHTRSNSVTRSAPRRSTKKQKRAEENTEKSQMVTLSKTQYTRNLNSIVLDIDNLNQSIAVNKFDNLELLTKVNIDQFLASAKIKNIQGVIQTDEMIFGTRRVFAIKNVKTGKKRSKKNGTRTMNMAVPLVPDFEQEASKENFKNAFFDKIRKGIDPITCFTQRDPGMTLEERTRGTMEINKPRNENLRKYFRKHARITLKDTSDEDLGFKIVKTRESNRNRVYTTNVEISLPKLRRLARKSGSINLIFFAYDKVGRKLDSYSQSFSLERLVRTAENPTLDFDIQSTRANNGKVFTQIQNSELHTGIFNVYQKAFPKSGKYAGFNFEKVKSQLEISPNNTKMLIDGNDKTTNDTGEIPRTKTVFQRATVNFENKEYSNTKSTGVPAQGSLYDTGQMSCSVYVIQDVEEQNASVVISNLSENVYAVLPIKRVARGTRGSDFRTVQNLSNGSLEDHVKRYIEFDDTQNEKSLLFTDFDVQDDVTYEYGAMLYSKSGHRQISGNTFLEKRIDKEDLIDSDVKVMKISPGRLPDNPAPAVKIDFEVMLKRSEDDVDKIINSLFGDNRSLFNQDLQEIKDASNLLYGVRVHRIDSLTGESSFVGSFRGFKQEDPNVSASTDIPKTYRAKFTDVSPAMSNQIYKFEPYIIPPSQVLDKVTQTLESIIKNKNRSRSTLNKFLVSKQKIVNSKVVSQIGTKFASNNSRRGSISSPKAFLEKNKNDLFLEGTTGDIVYREISGRDVDSFISNLRLQLLWPV